MVVPLYFDLRDLGLTDTYTDTYAALIARGSRSRSRAVCCNVTSSAA